MTHLDAVIRHQARKGMYPDFMLHRLGYHGKLAGNLYAVSQFPNAVGIIHGPVGCGFHYRLARDHAEPVFGAECTCLDEHEIVCGADGKLAEAILDVWERKRPDVIFLLPSTVSDVIGSDIGGVAEDIRGKVPCPIVPVASEVFSNRDRSALKRLTRDRINCWKTSMSEPFYDLIGCGYMEVLVAAVEHLMVAGERLPNTVNIESFGWDPAGKMHIAEISNLLGMMGIRVNAFIPGSSMVPFTRQAPRAALNIVRRGRRWALSMRDRFGVDYRHMVSLSGYHGIEGTMRFFTEIAERMQLPARSLKALITQKRAAVDLVSEARRRLAGGEYAFDVGNYLSAPAEIITLEREYSMPLRYVLVEMRKERLDAAGIEKETREAALENIRRAIEDCGSRAELIVNPEPADCLAVRREVSACISTGYGAHMREGPGAVPVPVPLNRVGFDIFVEAIHELARRVSRARVTGPSPLVSLIDSDTSWYPLVKDPDMAASLQAWYRVWSLREKETQYAT